MFYHFDILDNQIDEFNGEVPGTSSDFKQYEAASSFQEGEVYYKMEGNTIVEVIYETSVGAKYAREKVQEFLDNLMLS